MLNLLRLAALLAFALLASPCALAQGCGPTNPNCIVPTAPVGTSDNRAASTAFVQAAIAAYSYICNMLPAGVPCGLLNTVTANYSIQTTNCRGTVQAGTGSTGFFTLTVPSVSGFPSTCTVKLVNSDTGRAKRISGDPGCDPVYHYLWPGQSCTIDIVNGAWTATITPGRWALSGTTTFQADSTNGHDDGSTDCLATGAAACATITHAATLVCDQIDPHGQQINITPPNGLTQVENVALCNYLQGSLTATQNNPQILGNVSSPSSYVITPPSGIGVLGVGVYTAWTLNGITVGGGSTSSCVESDIDSRIYIKNFVFNTCTVAMTMLYDGKVEAIGPVSSNGNFAGAITNSLFGGQFLAQSITWTCLSNNAVGVWAQAQKNGVQNWATVTFSGCGGVTGIRYSATLGGGIDTNGGGATFLPGNSGGTATSPGWYN